MPTARLRLHRLVSASREPGAGLPRADSMSRLWFLPGFFGMCSSSSRRSRLLLGSASCGRVVSLLSLPLGICREEGLRPASRVARKCSASALCWNHLQAVNSHGSARGSHHEVSRRGIRVLLRRRSPIEVEARLTRRCARHARAPVLNLHFLNRVLVSCVLSSETP